MQNSAKDLNRLTVKSETEADKIHHQLLGAIADHSVSDYDIRLIASEIEEKVDVRVARLFNICCSEVDSVVFDPLLCSVQKTKRELLEGCFKLFLTSLLENLHKTWSNNITTDPSPFDLAANKDDMKKCLQHVYHPSGGTKQQFANLFATLWVGMLAIFWFFPEKPKVTFYGDCTRNCASIGCIAPGTDTLVASHRTLSLITESLWCSWILDTGDHSDPH